MDRELSKVGMFFAGLICGMWFCYLIAMYNFNLPFYPNLIALLCLFIIGVLFQE